jgi:predicted acyltransferase
MEQSVKKPPVVPDSGDSGKMAGRLMSLDAFRGLTIAGMILVNNPGGNSVYAPLEHAAWNGWTPTDLIFPFFLFIVGISITLSLARRVETGGGDRSLLLSIFRRTLIIFALGILIHGFPRWDSSGALSVYDFSIIRIPGVLQRIAVCYLFTSLIFLKTNWRVQGIILLLLLVAYWVLMALVPVPEFGAGNLSPEGSLASYVDRTLLAGHIYTKNYDPEGILSTLPAIATTLCGILTGHWLRTRNNPVEKVAGMFVAGATCVVLGWVWNAWFPVNKSLWTSSYVLFTAGLALQLLAICYWMIDIKGYRRWATPFIIFGVNAIAVYVLSALFGRIMSLWRIPATGGGTGNLKTFLFERAFASWASPVNASLAYSICYVLLWLGLMTILYRKNIFIKV